MGVVYTYRIGVTNMSSGRHTVKLKLRNDVISRNVSAMPLFVDYGLKGINLPKDCPLIVPQGQYYEIPPLTLEWISIDKNNQYMRGGDNINAVINKTEININNY